MRKALAVLLALFLASSARAIDTDKLVKGSVTIIDKIIVGIDFDENLELVYEEDIDVCANGFIARVQKIAVSYRVDIITSHHVTVEDQGHLQAGFFDGSRETLTKVAFDEVHDISWVRCLVDKELGEKLVALTILEDSNLNYLDDVYVCWGYQDISDDIIMTGKICYPVKASGNDAGDMVWREFGIHMMCIPGMSGSPVVNENTDVVGMVRSLYYVPPAVFDMIGAVDSKEIYEFTKPIR